MGMVRMEVMGGWFRGPLLAADRSHFIKPRHLRQVVLFQKLRILFQMFQPLQNTFFVREF
jgi:hypothetical protein